MKTPDEKTDIFSLIRDINILWNDVYPYLARHIIEVYGRRDGTVMEVGPFCGVIHEFAHRGIGDSLYIASFPDQMKSFYTEQLVKKGQADRITIIDTGPELKRIDDNSIDLIIFRGALFFPSLFTLDYQAIMRVLTPGGKAFVGGGFGKYTPPDVIAPIANLSRELNLLIGKKEVTAETILKDLRGNNMMDCAGISTDGGLWIVAHKGDE